MEKEPVPFTWNDVVALWKRKYPDFLKWAAILIFVSQFPREATIAGVACAVVGLIGGLIWARSWHKENRGSETIPAQDAAPHVEVS